MGTLTLTAVGLPTSFTVSTSGGFSASGAPTGNVVVDSFSVTINYTPNYASAESTSVTVYAPYGMNQYTLPGNQTTVTRSRTFGSGTSLSTALGLVDYVNGRWTYSAGYRPGNGTRYGVSALSITITIVYHTATVNTPTTDTPRSNPPPTSPTPAAPAPRLVTFVAGPVQNAAYDTSYTLTIDVTRNGVRDASAAGNMRVSLFRGGFTGAITTANSWSVTGVGTATVQTLTVAEGRASVSIQVPSAGATDGRYQFLINSVAYNGGATIAYDSLSPVFNIGTSGAGVGPTALKFTVQPSSVVALGAAVSCSVSAVNDIGTVQTGWLNSVTLTLEKADGGSVPDSWLKGTLAVTAALGVAAFSGLIITQPGRFRLRAVPTVAASLTPATSALISVQGDPVPGDIVGLRQNLLKDGTVFVGTTGYPTVSANPAITDTDMGYFDGDMNSANSKSIHGIRLVFPYPIALNKVECKTKFSSIAANPLVRILYSTDTTVGTDGTWTLAASYTPLSISVTRRDVVFGEPIYCKGIWATLDQNSGASTMNWYALHVFGGYVGPSFSIQNVGATTVDTEGILSIPKPAAPINTATTVRRQLLLRHNTSTDRIIALTVEAANEAGDAAVDDEVTLLDEQGGPLGSLVVMPAYGTLGLQLQYSSTAVPTLDGEHLVRVSVKDYDETTSVGAHVGVGIQSMLTNLTGTAILNKSIANIQATNVVKTPSGTGVMAVGYNTTATNLTRFEYFTQGTQDFMDITAPVTESEYTRIFPLTKRTGFVTRNSSGQVYFFDINEADMTEVAWLATSGRVRWTLPTTTVGPKTLMPGASGRIWIADGRSASAKIYQYDYYGNIFTTIDTATNLAGLVIDCHAYDPLNGEVYVVTRASAGSRKIARYNSTTGAHIASVTNSDEGGAGQAEGCSALGGYFYVYYNSRYLNRYDLVTLANNVRKYDNGAASYSDSGWKGYI